MVCFSTPRRSIRRRFCSPPQKPAMRSHRSSSAGRSVCHGRRAEPCCSPISARPLPPMNSRRHGSGITVPDLATGWSWNEDGTALTFRLREGVRWHDGHRFTAKDVQCTWDMLLGKSASKFRINPRKSWYWNLDRVARYLPPGATGSGSREERDRLLAEAEVIIGGWPATSWSGGGWAAPPAKGLRPKLRTLTLRTYHRRLTHRNPDLRVTSIDERGAPRAVVRDARH